MIETQQNDDQARIDNMHAAIGAAGIDLLAIAVTDNMRYAFGGYAPHGDERFCALLLSATHRAFVVPSLNAAQAKQRMGLDVPVFEFQDQDGPRQALAQALASLSVPATPVVALDEEMRAEHVLALQEARPAGSYRLAGQVIEPLRSHKDAREIATLQAAAATADAGVEAVFAAIAPGITELELIDIAGAAMRRAGAQSIVFATVGAGSHAALPHHESDSTALQAGDVVVIDIGSRLHGYCSDITRTAVVSGAPPDSEYARVHAVVEEAWRAAHVAARPGARARDVDAAARQVITAAGYGEYFVHRTGHGLGLSIHEAPYITSASEQLLEPGMVFSIEPGIYLPGRFGVRLEEIVYLDSHGAHVLSGLPRAARFCG